MELVITTKALKDLEKITPAIRARILGKVRQYANDPASLANMVTQLVGSPFYRFRVQDYRVIFQIDGEVAVVMTVLRVQHRRQAYE